MHIAEQVKRLMALRAEIRKQLLEQPDFLAPVEDSAEHEYARAAFESTITGYVKAAVIQQATFTSAMMED